MMRPDATGRASGQSVSKGVLGRREEGAGVRPRRAARGRPSAVIPPLGSARPAATAAQSPQPASGHRRAGSDGVGGVLRRLEAVHVHLDAERARNVHRPGLRRAASRHGPLRPVGGVGQGKSDTRPEADEALSANRKRPASKKAVRSPSSLKKSAE